MMDSTALTYLLLDELRELYGAETQILASLPGMIDAADDDELKRLMRTGLIETNEQIGRLHELLDRMECHRQGASCDAVYSILTRGESQLMFPNGREALDIGLLTTLKRMTKYKIAAYESARTYAHKLGDHDTAELLWQSLTEEVLADDRIDQLADRKISVERRRDEEPKWGPALGETVPLAAAPAN